MEQFRLICGAVGALREALALYRAGRGVKTLLGDGEDGAECVDRPPRPTLVTIADVIEEFTARINLRLACHVTSLPHELPSCQATSRILTMVAVMHHLVGAAEIQDLLGVSRQRVQQLIARPDFPKPVDKLKMGKVWRRTDVEKWARSRGRLSDEQ